jgi:hypothetical protein
LQGRVSKFREANPNLRQKVIQDAAEAIQNTQMEEEEFDHAALICVCELSAKLYYSHIHLVRYRISIQQG